MKSKQSSQDDLITDGIYKHKDESITDSLRLLDVSVLQAFLQNPRRTGAVWASSPSLSRALVENARVADAEAVVELGAGTGAVTEQIQSSMKPGARCISFELDPSLARMAAKRCPSVEVINSNVADMQTVLPDLGMPLCDSVVSCLPWTNLDRQSQTSILNAIENTMKANGVFVTFAYVHSAFLPQARNFASELKRRFITVETHRVIWANLPPAIILTARGVKSSFSRATKESSVDEAVKEIETVACKWQASAIRCSADKSPEVHASGISLTSRVFHQ